MIHIWSKYRKEFVIYVIIFVVALIFPVISTVQRSFTIGYFQWNYVFNKWLEMVPYVLLLLVHVLFLIPLLFYHKRKGAYVIVTILLLALFYTYTNNYHRNHPPRYTDYRHKKELSTHGPRRGPYPQKPNIRMSGPVLIDTLIALLLLGCSISIRLTFKHFENAKKMEELEKAHMSQELAQLKAQVSPHFFMNSLNNIHGMVEIDPSKAQDMILELSGMMRYVLYENSSSMVPLSSEIEFLLNYIALMRVRYPEDRVSITNKFPDKEDVRHIFIPSLVLIIFIENSFKHGVDYRFHSYVNIEISTDGESLVLLCENSRYNLDVNSKVGGVGLTNIRKRLDLLYGDDYTLDIQDQGQKYCVTLIIPIRDENQMFSSR